MEHELFSFLHFLRQLVDMLDLQQYLGVCGSYLSFKLHIDILTH